MKSINLIYTFIACIICNLYSLNVNAQCEELIWTDEFDGTALDQSKWNIEVNADGGGNNELQYYTDRNENIKVENGFLTITARKENYLGSQYTSARINTKNKGDLRYGRIEAKINLPKGKGIWSAFWMLPTEEKFGSWPASGELDIMEMIGSKPNQIFGTVHYGPVWIYKNDSLTLQTGNFSDDFHVYSVEWTPNDVKWYADGKLFGTKSSSDIVDAEGVSRWYEFQEKFFILLNLAVGGNWPGAPDNTTVFPQSMVVDYVRVYGIAANQDIKMLSRAYPNMKDLKFSINDIPNADFKWSVPEGATIVSGQNTHLISVDWGCAAGDVSVEIKSSCGSSTIKKSVIFDTLVIAADSSVYQSQKSVEFKVPELKNTNYSWTVPEGVTIKSGQNTSQIIADWGCSPGKVLVKIDNGCITENIDKQIELITPVLKGPVKVSENSRDVTYAIDNVTDFTYNWTVPDDAVIKSGQNSNQIVVDFGTKPGKITAGLTNACGLTNYSINLAITDTILLCDYENVLLNFMGWSGSNFEVSNNHLRNEVNNSARIGKALKTNSPWSGVYADLNYTLDFSKNKSFSVKVLGPKTGIVLFKIENPTAKIAQEVQAKYTEANKWQELKFNFPNFDKNIINRITLFYDFNVATPNTFYFDDIKFMPLQQTTMVETMNENNISVFPVPAHEKLYIDLFKMKNQTLHCRVISLSGQVVVEKLLNNLQVHEIDISGIDPGMYLIDIQSNQERYLRKIVIR